MGTNIPPLAIPAPGSLSSRQVGSRVMLPIAADPCGTAQLHESKGSAPYNRVSPKNQGMEGVIHMELR